jgi:hypothetical protein
MAMKQAPKRCRIAWYDLWLYYFCQATGTSGGAAGGGGVSAGVCF